MDAQAQILFGGIENIHIAADKRLLLMIENYARPTVRKR
jgi:hypothetical protein